MKEQRSKTNNQSFKNIREIKNILDKNYFHISIKIINEKDFEWEIYYNNLPGNIYYSKNNIALLRSKNNSISDIYLLKDKFEYEKNKVFSESYKEYINISDMIFKQIVDIRNKYISMARWLWLPIILAVLINVVYFKNTNFAFLNLILAIILGIVEIIQQNQIYKETRRQMNRFREKFIREKIRKQGLYFANKLR